MVHQKQEVEKMRRLTAIIVILGLWLFANPHARADSVLESGIKAEMEQRWDDALQIYYQELEQFPERLDLWLRVADIEAAQGRNQKAMDCRVSARG